MLFRSLRDRSNAAYRRRSSSYGAGPVQPTGKGAYASSCCGAGRVQPTGKGAHPMGPVQCSLQEKERILRGWSSAAYRRRSSCELILLGRSSEAYRKRSLCKLILRGRSSAACRKRSSCAILEYALREKKSNRQEKSLTNSGSTSEMIKNGILIL